MKDFFDFFKNCTEVKNFGFNAITLIAIVTILFTSLRMHALWLQRMKIYELQSAKSISVLQYTFYFSAFTATSFYGVGVSSVAISFNGIGMAAAHIPVLIGIGKYQGYKQKDIAAFGVFLFLIPAMLIIPDKEALFMAILIVSLLPLLHMNYKVYKLKSGKEIAPRYCIITIISCTFWFGYGVVKGVYPLLIYNFFAIVLFSLVLYLRKQYKKAHT